MRNDRKTAPVSKDLAAKIWRRNLRLTKGQKAVLVAIMDHTNATNISYPSLTLIAKEAGYDKTRVSRYIDEIAELGLITKSKRAASHGHFKPSQYLVNVGTAPTKSSNGPLASGAMVLLPPGQTKVFPSEGFTSEESQSSQTDGPFPTSKTKKTKTDSINYANPKSEEKSSPEFYASPPVDLSKWIDAMAKPMPTGKTIDKVYLRKACDTLRKAAPGVALKTPLPAEIFKPLAALYDEHGDTTLAELKNLMRPHEIELATATHEDQLERVLLGKPPGDPPKNKGPKPFVIDEPDPHAGISKAEVTKLTLKKPETAVLG